MMMKTNITNIYNLIINMISTLLCYASQALLYYYIAAIAILVVRRTVFAKIG